MSSVDLYLGSFLIISGFSISLLNLRKFITKSNTFSAVLISENVLLTCVGIAFVGRSVHEMTPFTSDMQDIEERTGDMTLHDDMDCNFISVLKSYGPLVVSLVNSFLSLLIDNFMHYKMLLNVKMEDEENTIQDMRSFRNTVVESISSFYKFTKKYFSYLVIGVQWIIPVLMALSMYSMEVKERYLVSEMRSAKDFCMAMVDVTNETCFSVNVTNNDTELRKFVPFFLDAYESNSNKSIEVDSIIENVNKIIGDMKNSTISDMNNDRLWRIPKIYDNCMKVCYLDNKSLLLYMFGLCISCYFVPITLSTVILTKIHVMEVKKPNVKTYVSRELMYNVLFWTPVIFDTFVSILLCSYSMNGMRTSIFNVIANVYQAVRNFMNTKYFTDNTINPVV